MNRIFLVFAILGLSLGVSCAPKGSVDKQETSAQTNTITPPRQEAQRTEETHWQETFETGAKGAYADGVVTLATGVWELNDALIAGTAADAKYGAKALRIKGSGSVTMNFNIEGGVGQVSIAHGAYGTDAPSTWQLWYSTDDGSTWTQTGSDITTGSATLSTETFALNTKKGTRLQLRKISGGRLNIDDITIAGKEGKRSAIKSGNANVANESTGTMPADDNMAMGNPSKATTSTANPNNYLMIKKQYALSYNSAKGIPNWVSWHLSSASLGSADRCNCFTPDASLPAGFYTVTTSHYSGSGFDRGHLCPSGDRTASAEDNAATFLMTNMTPQAPNMNEVTWEAFESYCRNLAAGGNELYIIAGWYGQGGNGHNGGVTNTIDDGRINVPAHFWKVAVILPAGANDAGRVTTATRVIAVDMPNIQAVKAHDWGYYRTSTDAIEQVTGYDLLSNVPKGIQAVIEARVDNGPTR